MKKNETMDDFMDRRRMFCVHCVECQAQSGIEKVRRKIFALLSLREGHALADAEKGRGLCFGGLPLRSVGNGKKI